MFFDPRIDRYGVWILWGALLVLGSGGQGCSSIPASRDNLARRGLFDLGRPALVRAVPARSLAQEDRLHRKQDLLEAARPRPQAFDWPLKKIVITSQFGRRSGGVLHQGLDLRASVGTPVHSEHSGRVIYAGAKIAGYGKLVVIKDSHGYSTIYAHNSKLLVLPGQQVERGQKIALSGATGTVRGAHLHFEVRHGVSPQDPEKFLSRR